MSTSTTPHIEATIAETLDKKLARRGVVQHESAVVSVVAERLQGFLADRIDGAFEVIDLRRMAGGASKEQFVFELDWSDGGGPRRDRMVLRMDPPASLTETPRLREAEVLQAVSDALPVPKVYWATDDPADLGSPAMVCNFINGVVAPAGAPKTASGLGTTYGEQLRPALAEQFVDHLAALHSFDWAAHELPSFERPRPGTTDAIEWRQASIDRMWDDDSFEPHPTVALARQWLWENRPPVDHISLIHGDYRNGNFLFDEASAKITAILDWELVYLGDRHHDLAYVMMKDWGEVAEDGTFNCCALMPRDDVIARYEDKSGLSVDEDRLDYYLVQNLYWPAVVTVGCGARSAAEQMTHLDVLQNFVCGLGVAFMHELNDLIGED
jgi:aminoglycoside phosphotransferase (APT) family kinase protein